MPVKILFGENSMPPRINSSLSPALRLGFTPGDLVRFILSLLGTLVVLYLFYALFIPIPSPGGRAASQLKYCFACLRVTMGAVEMYNIDNQPGMEKLNMEILLNQGYLKEPKVCPSIFPLSGPTTFRETGSLLLASSTIFCTYHGAGWLDSPGPGAPAATELISLGLDPNWRQNWQKAKSGWASPEDRQPLLVKMRRWSLGEWMLLFFFLAFPLTVFYIFHHFIFGRYSPREQKGV